MQIHQVQRVDAPQARGIVVVIDVIRAFSVAAYTLANGARALWLVREVEEAFALREREPEALLAGEVGGQLISGFDFNNSPALMAKSEVRGRLLIQRTGAGTRGAVNATNATHLLLCSLVNAKATAAYARSLAKTTDGVVTLMPTESLDKESVQGLEDTICAEYLEALLRERPDAAEVLAHGLERLRASGRLEIFEQGYPDFPADDVPAFLAADRFSFAMVGQRSRWNEIEHIVVRRVDVSLPPASTS